jgi:hypothetical protein
VAKVAAERSSRWQVTIQVTLTIDPAVVGEDHVAAIADGLVQRGGRLVMWQPELNGLPAKATFRFKNQARCDHFIAEAVAIPGVSLLDVSARTS